MNERNNDRIKKIRGEIFGILVNKVPKDEAEVALSQCLSFIRDTRQMENIATELGLKLSRFMSDHINELYFDIEKEGRDVGCISKGWDDQGFRLLEIFPCKPENMDAFRSNVDKILNLCATNGVGLGVKNGDGVLEFDLNINIYQDGFNASVLKNALETLEITTTKIKSYLND